MSNTDRLILIIRSIYDLAVMIFAAFSVIYFTGFATGLIFIAAYIGLWLVSEFLIAEIEEDDYGDF